MLHRDMFDEHRRRKSIITIIITICSHLFLNSVDATPQFWTSVAEDTLWARLSQWSRNSSAAVNTNQARNVVLFVGDGMGVSSVTLARTYKNYLRRKQQQAADHITPVDRDIEELLRFEELPHVGLSKVYNTDRITPDSAGTATALLCGMKTKIGVIGYDHTVPYSDCNASLTAEYVKCAAEVAQDHGLRTGLVTNTRVTHATPAPLYSKVTRRTWEANVISGSGGTCADKDIASQLIDTTPGQRMNVILGGGRREFLPVTPGGEGVRLDGRDLISEWQQQKQDFDAEYVTSTEEMEAVSSQDTEFLLGLFHPSHMSVMAERTENSTEPTVAQMTVKAIEMLQNSPKGYFLLVEGGRIDHAHHGNMAVVAAQETLAFEEAIARCLEMVDVEDTLVLVTADHSHTLALAGYPRREQNVFNTAGFGEDHLPYTGVLYATGPGNDGTNNFRPNLTLVDTGSVSYRQYATVPVNIATHSAEEVPVYGAGPWAHVATSGVTEQHYLAHAIYHAACLTDPPPAHCVEPAEVRGEDSRDTAAATFWFDNAKQTISENVNNDRRIEGMAKNVIIFLGDGMGVSTVSMSRIWKNHLRRLQLQQNEEDLDLATDLDDNLVFENLSFTALSKVYDVDSQVPDSAATATAFLCGVKAMYETVGVDDSVPLDDCAALLSARRLKCLAENAIDSGLRVGIVTTTRMTHATPAPLYSKAANRDWEAYTPAAAEKCTDIGSQLIDAYPGRNISVILGGGMRNFQPEPEGLRKDGRDLIDEWRRQKAGEGNRFAYVSSRSELDQVVAADTDYLMGLFNPNHLEYESERSDSSQEPTLAEMTKKAIEILSHGDAGYFLLVEGGRIDHAHHDNTAKKAALETLAFESAVTEALDMTDETETLVMVTADHSHTLSLVGYPRREMSIFDKVDVGTDNLPYTGVLYSTGPGHDYLHPGRANITHVDTERFDYTQQAAVSTVGAGFRAGTHAGEDVPVYSRGPWSHLITGVVEQHYLTHVLRWATCLQEGPGERGGHCQDRGVPGPPQPQPTTTEGSHMGTGDVASIILALFLIAIIAAGIIFYLRQKDRASGVDYQYEDETLSSVKVVGGAEVSTTRTISPPASTNKTMVNGSSTAALVEEAADEDLPSAVANDNHGYTPDDDGGGDTTHSNDMPVTEL